MIKLVLRLKETLYMNTNDVHFCELLKEHHGLRIGRETLRSLLRAHGVLAKNRRRPRKYRGRRQRKEALGAMVQIDASCHEWLGPMFPKLTLHGGIDDATNHTWAVFEDVECTFGYYNLAREIFGSHGLPLSLYSDRHTIFYSPETPSVSEQMKGLNKHYTQFGRAMKELGIEMIPAYSPQAKGRIERLWRTLQDRLAVELQMEGFRDKAGAQNFLRGFLVRFNKQFALKPRLVEPCFRKSPRPHVLDDILCLKENRVVNNDHTVSYQGRILQIPKPKGWRTFAKKRVEVWERQDGKIKIALDGKILATFEPLIEETLLDSAA